MLDMLDRLNRYHLYLKIREMFEQTRIMVCSIHIPINMQREREIERERALLKLGKPFLLKGNVIQTVLATIPVCFIL